MLKRTISRDQQTIAGAALRDVGVDEKDIRGVEETVNGLKNGVQDIKDTMPTKQDHGLFAEHRKALEEENAPLVG